LVRIITQTLVVGTLVVPTVVAVLVATLESVAPIVVRMDVVALLPIVAHLK